MKKLAAVFVTATLLLNAMVPTLAYAATYLQGAEVNAGILIQDAYVAVTYYDSKNKQTLAKGWIDAIDETSFTIRNGFWGKKTIAYDKVLSLILSEEETTLRQMNEVDRFIRNMADRGIETEQAAIQLLNQKTITTMPLRVRVYAPSIQKGQMVGRLIKMTQDTLVIQTTRTSQQVRAISPRRIRAPEDTQQGDITFYQVPITSISHLEVSMGQYRNTSKGLKIGLVTGLAIFAVSYAYVKNLESRNPDNIDGLAIFIFGTIAAPSALVISTLIGAITKSDKWVEVSPQRLNLSLAPTSGKGLRAALTFNF